MAKYIARHRDEDVTAITVGGKEYKAKNGEIEVPDNHAEAHAHAEMIGLRKTIEAK